MNLRRVRAISRKEFIQILRDPRSLAMAIGIPVMLLVLFGYALTLDVDDVPMVVWDRDNSQVARDFLLGFRDSRYFRMAGFHDNYPALLRAIDHGDAYFAMVIPKDFSQAVEADRRAPVQFLIDGSDSNTATIVRGYVSSVVERYNRELLVDALARSGGALPAAVDFRPRPWFNPNFESRIFIIPGLMAVIIMIISALLTSLTVAREWERGTMEQLIATPVSAGELVAGKFLPYVFIGYVNIVVAALMAEFVFDVPLRGSLALLFALSGLFLAGALAQGILISIVARNQLFASQMAVLTTFMPTFLLSGYLYPIWNMPFFIRGITYFVPSRYYIVVLRCIYLKGVGLRGLWLQTILLAVFAAAAMSVARSAFRKKVA
ncbi:MAG: ABC transporter permease [Chlamydiae bacterium]|nr:ABC transporter permease [Chlamydiota bacterium]